MRILHVLDHSLPLHSGYTFRTLAILREQRALGWETAAADDAAASAAAAGESRRSTAGRSTARLRAARTRELAGSGSLPRRDARQRAHASQALVRAVAARRPPCPFAGAQRAAGAAGRPAARHPGGLRGARLWEDAAVDHGTTREGSLRYRASRALETYALRRADHVTTICEGLRPTSRRAASPRARSP